MIIPQDMTKLEFFQDLYTAWRNANADYYERFERNLAQYQGDNRIDGSRQEADVVHNLTYELVESEISNEIPGVKVTPIRWSKKNDHNAREIERLCLQQRDELPFEKLNDLDERQTYIYGASVWVVEWDETVQHFETKGACAVRNIPPMDLTWDRTKTEIQDMECVFIRYRTSKDELVRRFDVSQKDTELADLDVEDTPYGDSHSDACTFIVAFYKDEEGNICKYSWSGELELEDINDYYGRKRKVCKKCGKEEGDCQCKHPSFSLETMEYEELEEDIILDRMMENKVINPLTGMEEIQMVPDKIMAAVPVKKANGDLAMTTVEEPVMDPETGAYLMGPDGAPIMDQVKQPKMQRTKIPYYKPKHFPIFVRRNVSLSEGIIGVSDCDTLRPYQQQINKIESRIQEKLLRSGVTPVIPDDAEVTINNSIFGNVIKLRPGETTHQYGIVDTTPNIQQDVQQSERIYDRARRVLGITESFQGNADNTAKSGIAKQAQIQQAAGRLQSKREMKKAMLADLYRTLFEFYLAYADERRHISYVDEFGTRQNLSFSRYDFLEFDPENIEYRYNDDYLFSADQSTLIEQQREAMWQLNLQNLSSGSLGNPQDPATLAHYWAQQEAAHYPGAAENVAYFRELSRRQQAQMQLQAAMQGGMMPPAVPGQEN